MAASCVTVGLSSPVSASSFTYEEQDVTVLNDSAAVLSEADYRAFLSLPPIPDEMLQFASDIQSTYFNDPSFSAVEVTPDRRSVKIWWFGAAPPDLRTTAESAAFDVTFEPTILKPADLRAAARIAITDSRLQIASAAPLADGSGLTVSFRKDAMPFAIDAVQSALGVPIKMSDQTAPTPARQNDRYGLGGARVYRWNGSGLAGACSTGFAVQKGNQQGMMFAAHCGAAGAQIVRWPDNTGSTVYPYGNDGIIGDVSRAHDAAVVGMKSNIGAIYTGPPENASGIVIAGVASPPIGAEICYSGSYTGFICGNIVEQVGISYSIPAPEGGNIDVTTGIRTEELNSRPAAGNGDSGGPGVLINASGQLIAGTIISAIPLGSGTTCNGTPGSDSRKCSKTVYSTPVSGALSATGWSIRTGR
jgi:hypothetical protein